MTSKISLFSKGIYKSTIRRYAWGSILYFIILFLSTSMPLMLNRDWLISTSMMRYLILGWDNLLIPLLTSSVVPTVVALLCFRFIHSKKAAVFTHSLPVTRTATYFSTLSAAFTLMFVPVILNGIILMILSLTGFSVCFGFVDCLIWIGILLFVLFIMFSAACFSATLTGNSFAMIVINVLFHSVFILIATLISHMAGVYVYGYMNTNSIVETLCEWNAFYYIFNDIIVINNTPLSIFKLVIFLIMSLVFYVLGWLLYKKRNLECAEDVAGYSCLNYIFKYLMTFVALLCASVFYGEFLRQKTVWFCLLVLLFGAIAYFASEMLLRKTFKVWKSYKGYILFSIIYAGAFCFMLFTSVFGYETRVPDIADVEKVRVVSGYDSQYIYSNNGNSYVEDEYIIEFVTNLHRGKIMNCSIPQMTNGYYGNTITISYLMKNGSVTERTYTMNDREFFYLYEGLYKSREYKEKNIEILYENIESIENANISSVFYSYDKSNEQKKGLVEALRKDIIQLDYSQQYVGDFWKKYYEIEYSNDEVIKQHKENYGLEYRTIDGHINSNFTNTLAFLSKQGNDNFSIVSPGNSITIMSAQQFKEYNNKKTMLREQYEKYDDQETLVNISNIEGAEIITDLSILTDVSDFILECKQKYNPDNELAYYICQVDEEGNIYNEVLAAFYEELGQQLINLIKG